MLIFLCFLCLYGHGEGEGQPKVNTCGQGEREGGGSKYTKNKWPFFVDELKVKGSKAENLYPGLNGSKENRIPAWFISDANPVTSD